MSLTFVDETNYDENLSKWQKLKLKFVKFSLTFRRYFSSAGHLTYHENVHAHCSADSRA